MTTSQKIMIAAGVVLTLLVIAYINMAHQAQAAAIAAQQKKAAAAGSAGPGLTPDSALNSIGDLINAFKKPAPASTTGSASPIIDNSAGSEFGPAGPAA